MAIYNLFEQSGTFKKQEKKLFYDKCYDIDIQNTYKETDYQVDLFQAIEDAYEDKPSFFDKITPEDLCFSFFPCTRFTEKIFINSKCNNAGMKGWDDLKKIEYSMNFMQEVNRFYTLFCKQYAVALKRNLKMIIENPYPGKQHYLELFFPFPRTYIDGNRAEHFDYYKKPTGFWFVNFPLQETMILTSTALHQKGIATIPGSKNKLKELGLKGTETELRSMISPFYAEWFLRAFVIENYKGDRTQEPELVCSMFRDIKQPLSKGVFER